MCLKSLFLTFWKKKIMREFLYHGVAYKSIKQCCAINNINYHKVRRLRRKYFLAEKDISKALDAAQDIISLTGTKLSSKYLEDSYKAYLRKLRSKDKKIIQVNNLAQQLLKVV